MNNAIPGSGNIMGRRDGVGSVMALLLLSTSILFVALGVAAAVLVMRPGKESLPEAEAPRGRKTAEVTFRTVVVNLKGERLTRLVQTTVAVQVQGERRRELEALLEDRKVLFLNWLIKHLSDKTIKDVEGAAALRKLQREIEDGFNAILASIGTPFEIEAVLFEEFNVQ